MPFIFDDLSPEEIQALIAAENAAIVADPVLANTDNYVLYHANGTPGDLAGAREARWRRWAHWTRCDADDDTQPFSADELAMLHARDEDQPHE